MTPDTLRPIATYTAPGIAVGWIAGCVFIVACCWRRLTRPSVAEETRRLQRDLDESNAQVRNLLDQNDRLARQLCERTVCRCDQTRAAGARKGAA